MTGLIHGLKIDSKAYALVNKAIDIVIEEGIGEAKVWLAEQCRNLKLKTWEQYAIGHCFTKLVDERL